MARKSTEVLAVELGERTIKVIQGSSRRKSLSVNRNLLVDTPAGSVEQYPRGTRGYKRAIGEVR